MEAKSIGLGNPPSTRDGGRVLRIAQMVARVMARVENQTEDNEFRLGQAEFEIFVRSPGRDARVELEMKV